MLRNYETDIELLNRQQKQQVEKAEIAQGMDLKFAARKLKTDQVSWVATVIILVCIFDEIKLH